jgi:HSP20 family protein
MADKLMRHSETGSTPAPRAHPLMSLRDEVDRLFENFLPGAFGRSLLDIDPWHGRSYATGDIVPHMDVRETREAYEISTELPGMDDKDVTVKVLGGVLTVSGEKKAERTEEKGELHFSERSYGSFVRSIRLPDSADADGIKADFAKGVLTITVPKRPGGAGEKKIEVQVH